MKRLSLSQAKAKLGMAVRDASHGETILLVDRQRPVAKIVRIEPTDLADEDIIREQAQAGVLELPRRGLSEAFFAKHPPVRVKRSVLDALLQERKRGDR